MTYTIALLIPICVGIVQVIKGFVPSRLLPVSSVVIGVGLAVLGQLGPEISQIILQGFVIGLSGVGLYNVGKKTVAGK